MPRFVPSGPTLAVSSFDVNPLRTYVAVAHAGGIRLYDSADHKQLAAIELPLGGEVDIVFGLAMGSARLLVVHRTTDGTDVRSFSLPRLEASGRLSMIGQVTLAASTLDHVVVWDQTQENVRIVGVAPNALSSAVLPLREPVQLIVAAPQERFLAAARDQYDVWDPMSRRALFRIQLPVPRPMRAGFSARRRSLWILSGATATPQLDVLRFSDGRPQARTLLDRRVLGVDGQADSERILVAYAGAAGTALELLDVTTLESTPFAVDGEVVAACLVEGEKPAVVVADAAGVVRFLEAPPASLYLSAIGERRAMPHSDRPQPPRRMERPQRPETPTAPGQRPPPSWRNRLVETPTENDPVAEPTAAPPDEEAENEADHGADNEADNEAAAPPAPKSNEAPAWRQQLKSTADARPVKEPRRRELPRTWRDAVLAASDGEKDLHDLLAESPLEEVVLAFQLPPTARLALTLAYAGWLEGRRKGVSSAALVAGLRRLLPTEEPEVLWQEALGTGELGQRNLVESRRGRLRLHGVVGRYLDGTPGDLRVFEHDGSAAKHAVELGAFRVEAPSVVMGLETLLGQVARSIGHDIAVVDLRAVPVPKQRRALDAAVLEAHLQSAVPLVLASDGGDGDGFVDALDGRLVIVAVPAAAQSRLAALPPLPLD